MHKNIFSDARKLIIQHTALFFCAMILNASLACMEHRVVTEPDPVTATPQLSKAILNNPEYLFTLMLNECLDADKPLPKALFPKVLMALVLDYCAGYLFFTPYHRILIGESDVLAISPSGSHLLTIPAHTHQSMVTATLWDVTTGNIARHLIATTNLDKNSQVWRDRDDQGKHYLFLKSLEYLITPQDAQGERFLAWNNLTQRYINESNTRYTCFRITPDDTLGVFLKKNTRFIFSEFPAHTTSPILHSLYRMQDQDRVISQSMAYICPLFAALTKNPQQIRIWDINATKNDKNSIAEFQSIIEATDFSAIYLNSTGSRLFAKAATSPYVYVYTRHTEKLDKVIEAAEELYAAPTSESVRRQLLDLTSEQRKHELQWINLTPSTSLRNAFDPEPSLPHWWPQQPPHISTVQKIQPPITLSAPQPQTSIFSTIAMYTLRLLAASVIFYLGYWFGKDAVYSTGKPVAQ